MKNLITRKLVREEERLVNNKPKRIYLYDYRYTTGQTLNSEDAEYVKNLKIPNKINNDSLVIFPKGNKVLFTYLDTKGRSIRAYSKKEIIKGFEGKYKRLRSFKRNYGPVVDRIIKDIRSPDPRIAQSALVLYIIYKTGLRIGSNTDTRADVKAHGISTLLSKHVKLIAPDKVKLDFIGKKGVRNTALIKDPLIYNELRKSKQRNSPIFDFSHNIVRKYLQGLDGRYVIKGHDSSSRIFSKREAPVSDSKIFQNVQSGAPSVIPESGVFGFTIQDPKHNKEVPQTFVALLKRFATIKNATISREGDLWIVSARFISAEEGKLISSQTQAFAFNGVK